MKRNKVMSVLNISTATVDRWLRDGKLKATKQLNGHWDYDDEIVYKLAGNTDHRQTVIYSRVSTGKQKQDLTNQIEKLELFCAKQGWKIDDSISEVASGLTFDKRKSFFKLLDDIQNNKIKRVVITHKNRLSRVNFSLFENIFKHHGTEIVVISNIKNEKTDNEEIFEEIISLLHCFSMRMYSKRRKKIKKVLDETGANTKTDTLKQRQTE